MIQSSEEQKQLHFSHSQDTFVCISMHVQGSKCAPAKLVSSRACNNFLAAYLQETMSKPYNYVSLKASKSSSKLHQPHWATKEATKMGGGGRRGGFCMYVLLGVGWGESLK